MEPQPPMLLMTRRPVLNSQGQGFRLQEPPAALGEHPREADAVAQGHEDARVAGHAALKAGVFVMPVVAAPVLAKHLEDLGADAIIAEGCESGGHIGEMTTMTLVPQVCDTVKIPVIAAGGIADRRQMAAVKALGACGAQVGTCLLVSRECPIHENYKQAILKAEGSDTIVTGRIGGTPVRVLKNRMAREYVRQEKKGASLEELEKYTLGSLRRAVFEGDTQTGSLMSGQVCGQLKEIRPVADILADLCAGF